MFEFTMNQLVFYLKLFFQRLAFFYIIYTSLYIYFIKNKKQFEEKKYLPWNAKNLLLTFFQSNVVHFIVLILLSVYTNSGSIVSLAKKSFSIVLIFFILARFKFSRIKYLFGPPKINNFTFSSIFYSLIYLLSYPFFISLSRSLPVAQGFLFNDNSLMEMVGVFLTLCITGPISEELFFRGMLYSYLKEKVGGRKGILLSALLFASIHPLGVSIIHAFLIGVILAILYEKSNSLLLPILYHFVNNLIFTTFNIHSGYVMSQFKFPHFVLLTSSILLLAYVIFLVSKQRKTGSR